MLDTKDREGGKISISMSVTAAVFEAIFITGRELSAGPASGRAHSLRAACPGVT